MLTLVSPTSTPVPSASPPADAPRPGPVQPAAPEASSFAGPTGVSRLTVLIPAYNESACVADTIRSVQAQTSAVAEIIVVDDCSTDTTGEVAQSCGVRVIRTPRNTGSKATALNYALQFVQTDLTLAIDADTTLAPDAAEKLVAPLEDPEVHGACGYVLPRFVRTIWEQGRYIEYLFAFSLYKPLQNYYEKPLLASGCFSVYRTSVLRQHHGWPTRTVAEDMDLTWNLYIAGQSVRFVEDAVCYPIEPHNYHFLSKQLRRWSCGFVQCVKVHWRDVLHIPFLRHVVAIGLWDATIASIAFLFLIPLLALLLSPAFLLAYLIDIPAVLVPVLIKAGRRGEVGLALRCLPGFFVIRFVNAVFVLRALWDEFVPGRSLVVFEKGH